MKLSNKDLAIMLTIILSMCSTLLSAKTSYSCIHIKDGIGDNLGYTNSVEECISRINNTPSHNTNNCPLTKQADGTYKPVCPNIVGHDCEYQSDPIKGPYL